MSSRNVTSPHQLKRHLAAIALSVTRDTVDAITTQGAHDRTSIARVVASRRPPAFRKAARAVDHRRLAFLYVIASLCWVVGRIEAAVGYSDAGQTVIGNDRDEVPFGIQGWLGSAYSFIGQPERAVERYRAEVERGRDTHTLTGAALVMALTIAGSPEEARAAATGLIDAAEATRNPGALSFALLAYGLALRDADPDRAREAMRRGLAIAQDSGNRYNETATAGVLARVEAQHGDPLAALDHLTVAPRL